MKHISEEMGSFKVTLKFIDCVTHGKGIRATLNGKCERCLKEKQEKQEKIIADKKLLDNKINAGIEERFIRANFENFKAVTQYQNQVYKQLKNYGGKKNVVFLGKTGTGKTHLACALIEKFLLEGRRCFYVKFYELLEFKIQNKQKFSQILNADFLVIDEYGSSDSDNKSNLLFEIIDKRYGKMLPTMLISNLSGDELRKNMNDATYSRIKSDCESILANWSDYRMAGIA